MEPGSVKGPRSFADWHGVKIGKSKWIILKCILPPFEGKGAESVKIEVLSFVYGMSI